MVGTVAPTSQGCCEEWCNWTFDYASRRQCMCLWGCDRTLGTLAPGGGSGLALVLWEVVFFFLIKG